MIPLAPPPGLTNDGVGGGGSGPNAGFQPALGMAQGEPGVLSWEVYPGSATSGTGHLWEDSIGATTASYTMSGATMTIRLSSLGSHTKRRHRFELQQVPPALSLSSCGAERTEVDVSASSYDGRNLVQNVFVTVRSVPYGALAIHIMPEHFIDSDYPHVPSFARTFLSHSCAVPALQAHATTLCVEVRFAAALDDQRVASLRAVPFKQIRQRLYILKQKFDDEYPQPSVPLMPLVETTNLATIMYEPPIGFQQPDKSCSPSAALLCLTLCCVDQTGSLTAKSTRQPTLRSHGRVLWRASARKPLLQSPQSHQRAASTRFRAR